ncbi:oxidoreductase-like protein [Periconia macrospinosa]|uniref:Oxidoreductase-like protein n=1 Tax=Periconia macrospinosa TaxID=97972 RepID=A0A2V1DCX9_9PLEO|nr:oxidoreductase-like protein [Periconia macrospinosa]
MSVQKAIQIQGPKVAKLVTDAPIPPLRPEYIRVKTVAVALNPTDWKHIDFRASKGAINGCDYAGVVEAVGSDVQNGLKVGDRVAGFIHGSNQSNHADGAFAEHVIAKSQLATKIPDSLSFEAASTLGCGITTVAQALYQSLELPWPTEPAATPFPILIYGGSTATGTLAIQFAKLSGLTVIATSSPRNFDLLKRYGADHVFDYKSPNVGQEIRKLTNDNLKHVLDCIAFESTAAICAEAISSKGGKYSALQNVSKFPRDDVVNAATLAYTGFGEPFSKGGKDYPALPDHLAVQDRFWRLVGELLAQGKIQPHPHELREGGLGGILGGLDDLRKDAVSGVKLVYRV